MSDLNSLYYAIGTTVANMQTLDILGIVSPFQDAYVPYTVEVPAADMLTYGHGFAQTAFHWGFITQAQRDTLKTFCSGKSATVFIRILDDSWSWVYCKASMIWQPETPPSNGLILDFSINFLIIENYGTSPP